MATATYVPLATQTLGSAGTVTFSSIPSTYTDLRLVVSVIGNSGNPITFRFNGDTGTNYSWTMLDGTGGGTGSISTTSASLDTMGAYLNGLSTTPQMGTLDIFSYAGSTYKTSLSSWAGDQNGSGEVEVIVHLWRSTSAINSIALTNNGTNFSAGSTFTLWGI
jgi:hypothetical protein